MKLLAIDTATHVCSAALLLDGELLVDEMTLPQGHSEHLLGMIQTLLQRADLTPAGLDALAFGRGPGSFTGLRIAAGVTQGIAFGADLPVVAVSNLAALALRAWREQGASQILPAFDARMGEVYWAGYEVDEEQGVRLVLEESVGPPSQVALPEEGRWLGVGEGWQAYADVLHRRCGAWLETSLPELQSSARDIALLAERRFAVKGGSPAETAIPVYLRNNVARKPIRHQLGEVAGLR